MKTVSTTGRERDAARIRQGNRAAAVGRLMLGEFQDWNEFLSADAIDLATLPRRQLRAGAADVKQRLGAEVRRFCNRNFRGMDVRLLSRLYEEVKASRGIELPLSEFQERFAEIRPEVLRGNPKHLTISISLWGLQFRFPEDTLAQDVVEAIRGARAADSALLPFAKKLPAEIGDARGQVRSLLRSKFFAARAGVTACFNLMEAYLNGLAWDFLRSHGTNGLSNRKRKLLDDSASVSIREKLLKYPQIISGGNPWQPDDGDIACFDTVKPFRDSLVHPSPFSAPERFGGYDKLRLLYRVDSDTIEMTVGLTTRVLQRIHEHVHGDAAPKPPWMQFLVSESESDSGDGNRPEQPTTGSNATP